MPKQWVAMNLPVPKELLVGEDLLAPCQTQVEPVGFLELRSHRSIDVARIFILCRIAAFKWPHSCQLFWIADA